MYIYIYIAAVFDWVAFAVAFYIFIGWFSVHTLFKTKIVLSFCFCFKKFAVEVEFIKFLNMYLLFVSF